MKGVEIWASYSLFLLTSSRNLEPQLMPNTHTYAAPHAHAHTRTPTCTHTPNQKWIWSKCFVFTEHFSRIKRHSPDCKKLNKNSHSEPYGGENVDITCTVTAKEFLHSTIYFGNIRKIKIFVFAVSWVISQTVTFLYLSKICWSGATLSWLQFVGTLPTSALF